MKVVLGVLEFLFVSRLKFHISSRTHFAERLEKLHKLTLEGNVRYLALHRDKCACLSYLFLQKPTFAQSNIHPDALLFLRGKNVKLNCL